MFVPACPWADTGVNDNNSRPTSLQSSAFSLDSESTISHQPILFGILLLTMVWIGLLSFHVVPHCVVKCFVEVCLCRVCLDFGPINVETNVRGGRFFLDDVQTCRQWLACIYIHILYLVWIYNLIPLEKKTCFRCKRLDYGGDTTPGSKEKLGRGVGKKNIFSFLYTSKY